MKKTLLILLSVSLTACILAQPDTVLLYKSDAFSLYGNRVEQGKYKAVAESDSKIASNYQSPANLFFNPEITYKYAINGYDNEAAPGNDHKAYLRYEKDKRIVVSNVFGEKDKENEAKSAIVSYLPANTTVHFRLDMRKVMTAFAKDGFYKDYKGNKIFKSDFKGVWIAGGTYPLKWDFDNLSKGSSAQLKDDNGDGIYTLDMIFNAYNPNAVTASEWNLSKDISQYPSFSSKFSVLNSLYRLSLEEMVKDVRDDSTFMAGKEWTGVWTRDISYSIILSLAIIEPEIAKNSLLRKVKNKRIIQDTGTGGSWPCSTDREVWALAAWEVYKTTGDTGWLKQVYEIISNSINDDLKTAYNFETGLFYGESSFLDWRKQTYPLWMEPADIYRSHCLGTNAVFYEVLITLDKMSSILQTQTNYGTVAEKVKQGMNKLLWNGSKGYYGQYLYGRLNYSLSPKFEALGEALCLLYNIADSAKAQEILKNTPIMEFGIPTIYPQIPGIPPYHNQSVWPFVQAYWTLACAKYGYASHVEHGMACIFRQAALFLTNKENMVVETGDFKGTEINSDRQLWSVAGNLALFYKLFFGIQTTPDKLVFKPYVPINFKGEYILKNFKYRNALLDIHVENFGSSVASFEIDGVKSSNVFIPAILSGKHSVRIILDGKIYNDRLNMVKNKVSPEYPEATLNGSMLQLAPVKEAGKYRIYRNGEFYKEIIDTILSLEMGPEGEYQVSIIDFNGTESFLCKPVFYSKVSDETFETEAFMQPSERNILGFFGRGFVEINKNSNPYQFNVIAKTAGEYLVYFRYANGNGPINTDNKCGIRTLYCNDSMAGTAVFPQRGDNEWSNWGYSNPLKIKLSKGMNQLELRYEMFNQNMNIEVNDFIIDQIVLIKEIE